MGHQAICGAYLVAVTLELRGRGRHLLCHPRLAWVASLVYRGRRIASEAAMDDRQNVQINMQRIPVGSSVGAAALIAILLLGMFLDLPGVRGTAIGGGAIGLLLAGVLIGWRRRKAGSQPHPTLGITAK